MKIIFTHGSYLGSWIIENGLGEDVSHCALDFGQIVVHSSVYGCVPMWRVDFLKGREIRYSIDTEMSAVEQFRIMQKLNSKYGGKPYDWFGVFYLALRVLFLRLFKMPLPEKNAWASHDAFSCVELVKVLPEKYLSQIDLDLALVSPKQLYNKMRMIKWS